MTPILYPADEALKGELNAFKSNGLGKLNDAATCVVHEKKNSEYELEMTYPVSGIHFSEIAVDMFILAKPSEYGKEQAFRIYEIEEPLDGLVTIRAEHISYLLTKVVTLPFSAYSVNDAFLKLQNNLQWNTNAKLFKSFPFSFWTDKNSTGTANIETPMSVRSALGGTEGSILDAFGGEYEFDMFTVKLHNKRGTDNGVNLRYGKNITDITNSLDISGAYTGILPYWKGNLDVTADDLDENESVQTESVEVEMYISTAAQNEYISSNPSCTNYVNDKSLWISNNDNIYAYPLAIPVDLSSMEVEEYEEPELEQLEEEEDVVFANRLKVAKQNAEAEYRAYLVKEFTKEANRYLNDNAQKRPKNSIKISFAQLWNTEEYADIAPLEHVDMGDTVHVYYPEFDIRTKTTVVETEYNVLLDRYDSLTLGDVGADAVDSMLSSVGELEDNLAGKVQDDQRDLATVLKQRIAKATELIRGGLGGYIIINTNPAGQPNELLIMDKPTKSTAHNVWRWNLGGLGFSDHGYNGPFDKIAITMDGSINASMISTGIMDATRIRTGIIQDVKGYNYWDLDSGEFRMAATVKVGSGNDTIASVGTVNSSVNNAVTSTLNTVDGKISTAMNTLNSNIASAISTYDSVTLNQTKVFNKLTNNGAIQGLYMQGQQLYINAEYVSSGTFKTADKKNGQLTVLMEGSTAAIKGYYNQTLIGLIDLVNGTNTSTAKMVISAKNGIALLSPNLYVKAAYNGTHSMTGVYKGSTSDVPVLAYIGAFRGTYMTPDYGENVCVTAIDTTLLFLRFINGIYVGTTGSTWNADPRSNNGIMRFSRNDYAVPAGSNITEVKTDNV